MIHANDLTLKQMLRKHEAVCPQVYDDKTGKAIGPGTLVQGNPTIGVGILVGPGGGLLPHEIDYLLDSRTRLAFNDARFLCDDFDTLTPNRQRVLVSMAFNLGRNRLSKFRRMFAAIERHDYASAADEMLDSKWAYQVGERAQELSRMMRDG